MNVKVFYITTGEKAIMEKLQSIKIERPLHIRASKTGRHEEDDDDAPTELFAVRSPSDRIEPLRL